MSLIPNPTRAVSGKTLPPRDNDPTFETTVEGHGFQSLP